MDDGCGVETASLTVSFGAGAANAPSARGRRARKNTVINVKAFRMETLYHRWKAEQIKKEREI